MAIVVTTQPATNSINAGYRPIVIKVTLSEAMPIVFCDIYFNGIYYKSISLTDLGSLTPEFDIQDAVQEYLTKRLGINGSPFIEEAPQIFASCMCKFRGSSINVDGFTIAEPVIPIQATLTTPAVAGTGTSSNTFFVVNCALQHDDNQSLSAHLNNFKTGTWSSDCWPLSHRHSKYRIAGSDFFPILYIGTGIITCLKVYYTKKDGTTGNSEDCDAGFPNCPVIAGITIGETDLLDGTQDFDIAWTSPNDAAYSVLIQYRLASGGGWTNLSVLSSTLGTTINLPLGLYDFKFTVYSLLGLCTPQLSSLFEDEGIPTPCTAVGGGTYAPPDAVETLTYSYVYALTGTAPFTISAITKPSWMSIVVSGSNVVFSGTPPLGSAAAGQTVAFTIDNDCGTINRTDTINTTELETGIQIQATWGVTEASPCIVFPGYLYLAPPNTVINTGLVVYTDPAMTSPLTGALFIQQYPSASNIFEIDSITGVIGGDTGLFC